MRVLALTLHCELRWLELITCAGVRFSLSAMCATMTSCSGDSADGQALSEQEKWAPDLMLVYRLQFGHLCGRPIQFDRDVRDDHVL
jgi:hypothetical protein